MEENFNHEKSLTLINEMIHRAQNNVKEGKTYSIIFWGYVVAATAVMNCVLLHTLGNPNQSFLIWLLMFPAVALSHFIERRDKREMLVKTHIDKIGSMVWTGFLISNYVFLGVVFAMAFRLEAPRIFMTITPVILTMIGLCEFVTACIYRSKSWYSIAALFWVGAVACALLSLVMQFIILALCMIFGFIIPGYILNHQAKKSHV